MLGDEEFMSFIESEMGVHVADLVKRLLETLRVVKGKPPLPSMFNMGVFDVPAVIRRGYLVELCTPHATVRFFENGWEVER